MVVSENEIGLREGRAKFGDLVNRAEYAGQTTYITRHGRRVAAIVPIDLVPQEQPMTVTWSVVRGEAPYAQAVEPHQADVAVPADILDWAVSHGFSEDDPEVYILVTPKDEAGEIPGEVAYTEGTIPADEFARLRDAVAELNN